MATQPNALTEEQQTNVLTEEEMNAVTGERPATPEPWRMYTFKSRRKEERAKLVSYRKPSDLEVHPLNVRIYGEPVLDQEFLTSIKQEGVLEPIVLVRLAKPTPEISGETEYQDYILSGHRRWAAAKQVGLERVPTRHFSVGGSVLEVEKYLILYNQQRIKTPEQIAREFTELKRIETELAKERQGTRTDLGVPLPQSARGKARDKAAAKLGKKARTLEKMAQVVAAADLGNPQARVVVDEVNRGEKSVHAAFKEVVKSNPEDAIPDVSAAHQEATMELQAWIKEQNVPATVSRSKIEGRFNLTLSDLTADQVRAVVRELKEFARYIEHVTGKPFEPAEPTESELVS